MDEKSAVIREESLSWEEIFIQLSEPMEYEIKPKAVAKRGSGFVALALGYISRVHVQDRLDSVLGPGGWQVEFRTVDSGAKIVECRLSICRNGMWIAKADVGSPQGEDVGDEWKGAYSDAFKRAATMFGIGRFLYTEKAKWLPCAVHLDGTGHPVTRNGKFVFRSWLESSEESDSGEAPAPWDTAAPAPPHSSSVRRPTPKADVEGVLEEVTKLKNQYGEELRCKYCGSVDTSLRMTSGRGKVPKHLAIWCQNPACESQSKSGYSYPATQAGEYNEPIVF